MMAVLKEKGELMELYNLIVSRHSERKYLRETVSKEDIQKIVEAGLSAPSGMNTQPWHFTVIQNKETQKEIVETCRANFLKSGEDWRVNWAKTENFNPFYGADVIIVISNKSQVNKSKEDCPYAIQNMTIMAEGLGLSSCIIKDICWGIDKSNQEKYGIPSDYECYMSLVIGKSVQKNTKKKTFDYSKVNYID